MSKGYMNNKTTAELCEKLWIGLVTTMTKSYVEKGTPLIRNSDIKQNKISKDLINLDTEFANLHSSRTVKTGDVVTVHTGNVGVSSVVPKELNGAHGFATINSRLKKEFILPEYYCWFLNSDIFKEQVYQVITGDGRNNLNLNDFINLKVYYPSLPIQKKTIEFLNITNSIIEKTQAAIAKYKAIKQGMLNDLFTRGIDIKTGKLRPKQEDAPELYKESELGWIPKEWNEKEIKQIGDVISGATPSTTNPDFWGGEIVWITPADLSKQKDAIYFQKASRKITELGLQNCSANLISENNLVISSRAPIGYLSIVKVPFTINQGCKSIKFFENEVPEYYYYNLLFNLNRLKNFGEGTTFAEISKDDFEIFTLPVCKEIEQKLISNKLQTVDNSINSEQTYLQKLQQIKSGLMADLLSGKKLVNVPSELETETRN